MVLVLCLNGPFVLLVLKDRPAWQKGKLNLPGGKIESGETIEQTAIREFKEETGYVGLNPKVMGKIQDGEVSIHCVKIDLSEEGKWKSPKPQDGETELPMWMLWSEADHDPRVIPNLRLIVPLMMAGSTDWVIDDTYKGSRQIKHDIKIHLPTRVTDDLLQGSE